MADDKTKDIGTTIGTDTPTEEKPRHPLRDEYNDYVIQPTASSDSEVAVIIDEDNTHTEGKGNKSGETKTDTTNGDKQGEPTDSAKAEKQDTKKDESSEGKESGDDDENLIDPDDPRGVRKRINKAVKRQKEAERAAEEAQKKLDELNARLERLEKGDTSTGETDDKPAAKATTAPVKPKKDDFDDYDEYQNALDDYHNEYADWKADEAVKKVRAEIEAKQRQAEIEKRFDEGRKKYADFDEVALSPDVPCTELMAETIAETLIPEEIAYYLGSNMDIADEIAGMKPIQQVRAIGRLEVELQLGTLRKNNIDGATQDNAPPSNQTKKATNAPPPINPVKGEAGSKFDLSKVSTAQYRKIRAEQEKRDRRGLLG